MAETHFDPSHAADHIDITHCHDYNRLDQLKGAIGR